MKNVDSEIELAHLCGSVAVTGCASACFTAKEWMELYDSAAAAHLDVQAALKRLIDAYQPKPFGGIADEEERKWAIHENSVEALEATRLARQTLGKYDPFIRLTSQVQPTLETLTPTIK